MKILTIFGVLSIVLSKTWPSDGVYVPVGYFPFEKAPASLKPPKVRKPPYFPADTQCPGINDIYSHSPRDTLCGDLNKGFVPRNPMDHNFNNEPYPFELIKNKTLHFLANALPMLKKDINNMPKVARFVGVKRNKYQPQSFNFMNVPQMQFLNKIRQKRDVANNTIVTVKPEVREKTEKNCEGTNKLLCQMIHSYREEGSISKSILNTVAQAFGNAATIGNIASLVQQYGNGMNNGMTNAMTNAMTSAITPVNENLSSPNKSSITQLLSTLTGLSSSGNYNPLMSILDFVANYQSASSKSPTRRRNPEDETSTTPVTPCPSMEEYVTPVFARNYQGVWKYVVQIPNEGYFTQTIQRTTCLKNKCEYLDGACKESPRWVSLLVAEIFYPNMYFPINQLKNDYQSLYHLATSNLNVNQKIPSVEDFYNFQQYLQKRVGDGYSPEAVQIKGSQEAIHPRRFKRNVNNKSRNNLKAEKVQEQSNDLNQQTEECDGHDKIGCYVVRVYYDWFLVNGSCKCWKSSGSSSINEAIKRIFVGK